MAIVQGGGGAAVDLPGHSAGLGITFNCVLLATLLFVSVKCVCRRVGSLSKANSSRTVLDRQHRIAGRVVDRLCRTRIVKRSLDAKRVRRCCQCRQTVGRTAATLSSLHALLASDVRLTQLSAMKVLFVSGRQGVHGLLGTVRSNKASVLCGRRVSRLVTRRSSLLDLPRMQGGMVARAGSCVVHGGPGDFFGHLKRIFSPKGTSSARIGGIVRRRCASALARTCDPTSAIIAVLGGVRDQMASARRRHVRVIGHHARSLHLDNLGLDRGIGRLLDAVRRRRRTLTRGGRVRRRCVHRDSVHAITKVTVITIILTVFFLILV